MRSDGDSEIQKKNILKCLLIQASAGTLRLITAKLNIRQMETNRAFLLETD